MPHGLFSVRMTHCQHRLPLIQSEGSWRALIGGGRRVGMTRAASLEEAHPLKVNQPQASSLKALQRVFHEVKGGEEEKRSLGFFSHMNLRSPSSTHTHSHTHTRTHTRTHTTQTL